MEVYHFHCKVHHTKEMLIQQKEARLREQIERSRLDDIESESRSWEVLQNVSDLKGGAEPRRAA
jgi:hypothetical protein